MPKSACVGAGQCIQKWHYDPFTVSWSATWTVDPVFYYHLSFLIIIYGTNVAFTLNSSHVLGPPLFTTIITETKGCLYNNGSTTVGTVHTSCPKSRILISYYVVLTCYHKLCRICFICKRAGCYDFGWPVVNFHSSFIRHSNTSTEIQDTKQ